MSSMQGTTQAYQPLADTYIALAPSCGDKIFGTDINYCNLVSWGIYDGQENDPRVLQSYLKQQNNLNKSVFAADQQAWDTKSPTSYSNSASNQDTTVWSLMKSLPQLSTMARICERSGWKDYIDRANPLAKITVFAPNNQAFQTTQFAHVPYEQWNKNDLRLVGQAHTLPFAFQQSDAIDRKLRLYTSLDSFSVFIDGTGEVSDKLNFYIPPTHMLSYRYPNPLKRINVVQGYYTQNGALYEIDGVFQPQVYIN